MSSVWFLVCAVDIEALYAVFTIFWKKPNKTKKLLFFFWYFDVFGMFILNVSLYLEKVSQLQLHPLYLALGRRMRRHSAFWIGWISFPWTLAGSFFIWIKLWMLPPYNFFGRSRTCGCVLGPFLNLTRSLLSSSIFLQISEALRSKNIFCYLCFTDGII